MKMVTMVTMMVAMVAAMVAMMAAADPDPINDFCVADLTAAAAPPFFNGLPCKDPATVTAADFRSAAFRAKPDTGNALGIALGFAAAGATLPGLNTQGLALVKIDYAKTGGFVPPHVHPRASEVIYVLEGAVDVGFVDTSGRFFNTTLYAGDVFVFPRGLLHYQSSQPSPTYPSLSISALNSQNPGLSLVASALFASTPGIPDAVLAKTLAITPAQVEDIKKAFGAH